VASEYAITDFVVQVVAGEAGQSHLVSLASSKVELVIRSLLSAMGQLGPGYWITHSANEFKLWLGGSLPQ
jgi:hypothetical protein